MVPQLLGTPVASVYNRQQHFVYRGKSGIVWDSWFDSPKNSWHLQQINGSGVTAGPLAAGDPSVSAHNDQHHFAYRENSGAIWDSWYDGPHGKWNLQKINLGGVTSGVPAIGGPQLWSFFRLHNHIDQQHVTYRDASGLIWDAVYETNDL